jgi:hypothetical protein
LYLVLNRIKLEKKVSFYWIFLYKIEFEINKLFIFYQVIGE